MVAGLVLGVLIGALGTLGVLLFRRWQKLQFAAEARRRSQGMAPRRYVLGFWVARGNRPLGEALGAAHGEPRTTHVVATEPRSQATPALLAAEGEA